jgi:hypothetical protein
MRAFGIMLKIKVLRKILLIFLVTAARWCCDYYLFAHRKGLFRHAKEAFSNEHKALNAG